MRGILFKAKRKDNGEWVEGSLIITEGSVAYIIRSKSKAFIPKGESIICSAECYEINPDTLCQYTGLTDKNGQKIWENDIVKWRFKRAWKEDYHISQVVWDSFYSAFKISVRGGLTKLREDIEYEVISNIFDNPELLEVE